MVRWLAVAAVLAAGAARAAPPLLTEDTGTQGAGRWHLEATGELAKQRATRQRTDATSLELAHGYRDALDLQASVPWHRDGADGFGDVALEAKWRFHERGPWSLGLKPGITLPTGNERKGRGTGKLTWGGLLVASWQPEPLAVHAHLGYRRNENKLGERESLQELAVAGVYALAPLRLVAEIVRQTNPVRGGGAVRYATLGAVWPMRREFDLALAWRDGGGGAAIDNAWILGATLRW